MVTLLRWSRLSGRPECSAGSSLQGQWTCGSRSTKIKSYLKRDDAFAYLLHALKELAASVVGDVESSLAEVGGEEIGEGGHGVMFGVVVGVLAGEGRLEQDGGLQAEALQVGVKQLPGRVHPGSLEGVSRNHGRVSVI